MDRNSIYTWGKLRKVGGVEMENRKALSERLPEEVFNRIHQDIGEASMCWTNIDGAGTFDSEHASRVAFELCHYVADLLRK